MPSSGSIDFLKIVQALAEAEADVVIVGGLAVQLHGSDYLTQDVDFAWGRVRENARRIADALADFHPRPRGLPDDLPFVWDDATLMNSTVITLRTDIGIIDLLAEPDGAPKYDELKRRAVRFELGSRTVYVASIDDLISMKRAAGRPKDLAHIAELESIRDLQAEGE